MRSPGAMVGCGRRGSGWRRRWVGDIDVGRRDGAQRACRRGGVGWGYRWGLSSSVARGRADDAVAGTRSKFRRSDHRGTVPGAGRGTMSRRVRPRALPKRFCQSASVVEDGQGRVSHPTPMGRPLRTPAKVEPARADGRRRRRPSLPLNGRRGRASWDDSTRQACRSRGSPTRRDRRAPPRQAARQVRADIAGYAASDSAARDRAEAPDAVWQSDDEARHGIRSCAGPTRWSRCARFATGARSDAGGDGSPDPR